MTGSASQKRIVVIGIATVDAIARTVDAWPRPGGLRFFEQMTLATGGCAINAAIALARLGRGCEVVARVGSDVLGDFVVAELAKHGLGCERVVRDREASTSFSFAAVHPGGERSFLHTKGANARFRREDVPVESLPRGGFVLVTGAMLMDALDGEPAAGLLEEARAKGATTMLDTVFVEGVDRSEWLRRVGPVLPHLDYFVPSEPEAVAITGLSEPRAAARDLQARGARNVVVKLGGRGVWFRQDDRREGLVAAFPVGEIADTTGAGDCWCAGFLVGLSDGQPIDQAAGLGNAVAAHCIGHPGATAGVPPLEQVIAFMTRASTRGPDF